MKNWFFCGGLRKWCAGGVFPSPRRLGLFLFLGRLPPSPQQPCGPPPNHNKLRKSGRAVQQAKEKKERTYNWVPRKKEPQGSLIIPTTNDVANVRPKSVMGRPTRTNIRPPPTSPNHAAAAGGRIGHRDSICSPSLGQIGTAPRPAARYCTLYTRGYHVALRPD